MIVSFSVSNYKTFDYTDDFNNQTILFTAGRARSKPEHIFRDVDPNTAILKTGMILGANSSGKSNLISALRMMKNIAISDNLKGLLSGYDEFDHIIPHIADNNNDVVRFKIVIRVPKRDSESIYIENENQISSDLYDYTVSIKRKKMGFDIESTETEFGERYELYSEVLKLICPSGDKTIYCFDYETYKEKTDHPIAHGQSELRIIEDELIKYDQESFALQNELKRLRDQSFDTGLLEERDMLMKERAEIDVNLARLMMIIDSCYNDIKAGETDESKQLADLKLKKNMEQLTMLQARKAIIESHIKNNEMRILDEKRKQQEREQRIDVIEAQIRKNEQRVYELQQSLDKKYDTKYDDRSLFSKSLLARFIENDFTIAQLKKLSIGSDFDKTGIVHHCRRVFDWFNQTLEVISPVGSVFPPMGPDKIEKISPIISKLDLHIKELKWIEIDDYETIVEIQNRLNMNDKDKISLCSKTSIRNHCGCSTVVASYRGLYIFSYWNGELSVKKLCSIHHDGTIRDIEDESAGTRRIIQIASILLDTNEDKVYVVDELDSRIHMLLVRAFVETFLKQSSEHKQLIFTTHDTKLLTTELFRSDEIWFINRDGFFSKITAYEDLNHKTRDRLENEYLNGKLGGIPKIG